MFTAFWSKTTDKFNDATAPWSVIYIIIACLSMFFPFWSLGLMLSKLDSYAESVMLVILLIITAFTAVFVLLLHVSTTASFLGQMLAQRWNPLSYVAGLGLTAMCWYSSALMCGVYIIREIHGFDDPHFKPVLSTLSLVFFSLSFWFPDPVQVTDAEIAMTPSAYSVDFTTPGEVVEGEQIPGTIYRIPDVFGLASAIAMLIVGPDNIDRDNPDRDNINRDKIERRRKHTLFIMAVGHYFFVVLGSILAYIFMGFWFTENWNRGRQSMIDIAAFFNIIVSGFGMVLLLVTRMFCPTPPRDVAADGQLLNAQRHGSEVTKRRTFMYEILMVFCLINGVVLAVLAESDYYQLDAEN